MLNARWTIALWVILIILFVAFYRAFNGAHEPALAPRARETAEGLTLLARWFPMALFGLFFVLFAAFYALARKRQGQAEDGVRMLNRGRYAQALEAFDRFRKAQPENPAGVFNCGLARLYLWKLEAAALDFETTQKMAHQLPALRALLPEYLALTYALLGFGAEARKQVAQVSPDTGEPGLAALASAILLAREGQWAPARARLDTFEVKQMPGTIGALSRTLDALCVERLTLERRHIDRIALFGEAAPDELGKHWPEFVDFVERAPAW